MAEEDLERYETDVELKIYKEYRDVLPMFRYVIETERRFYLANGVELKGKALTMGPKLTMDSATERFTGRFSKPANALLKRTYREPFVIREEV